jgi:hypothetical protein
VNAWAASLTGAAFGIQAAASPLISRCFSHSRNRPSGYPKRFFRRTRGGPDPSRCIKTKVLRESPVSAATCFSVRTATSGSSSMFVIFPFMASACFQNDARLYADICQAFQRNNLRTHGGEQKEKKIFGPSLKDRAEIIF